MTVLVFLSAVALIFGAVLALEARASATTDLRRPLGIIGWLTGGNWPAKVGGGLLLVGIGSLLRYALINFDVSPSIKLGTGIVATGLLGLAAMLTRMGAARRAVSLALGGAAFGVAYLTAYSAFALFHYLQGTTGIALLALTAAAAGVYAITRGALSLALLAMVGAFMAPGFAPDDPGPLVVYGYYTGASALTLVMVAARGWRPLIHLSFLFTLAGGVFLAWTAHYFRPEYASVMLPAVVVLAALHVAMPLAERHGASSRLIERLDVVYLIALPAASALAALVIAPTRVVLSNELLSLGVLWAGVAGYLWLAKREGSALHGVVATLLLGLGVAARYRNLPWELIALAFSVAALWVAARHSKSARLHNVLAGLVPLLGLLHVVSSLAPATDAPVFINGNFLERMVGALLLMAAGHICRRIRQSLDTLLWTAGIGWALIAIGSELVRWDLVSLALIVHWTVLAVAVVLAILSVRSSTVAAALVAVPIVVVVTASWAAVNAPLMGARISLLAAPLVLVWVAIRRAGVEVETRPGRLLCAVLAPVVAGLWAVRVGTLSEISAAQFPVAMAAAVLLLALWAGHVLPQRARDWWATVAEMSAFAYAAALLLATAAYISRSPWAQVLEALSLAGLFFLAYADRNERRLPRWIGPGAALGAAFLIQAHLLRWLGPSGDLTLWDIGQMRWPTLVSLLWVAMGAALTIWGRRKGSRASWLAGASLLVASAVKLVLVDFGSLGQLTNILALIAAGIVFMLVGWLAPMPPAAPAAPPASVPLPPAASRPVPASAAKKATGPASVANPEPLRVEVAAASPGTSADARGAESTASGNDYWERNASRTAQSQVPTHRDEANRKTAWTIAILAALILPLTQCSHLAREAVRFGLGLSRSSQDLPVVAVPAPEPAPEPEDAPPPRATTPDVARDVGEPIAAPVIETECSQWRARLPSEYTIYAAGEYKGHQLDFAIDDSNHRATSFDVTVHEPDRNVVLLLGSYEPAIWSIRWSAATHIVGVWVSGYYAQQVTGLEPGTPVLHSNSVVAGACPAFYVTAQESGSVAVAAQRVLERRVDKLVLASDGRVSIGHTEDSAYYVHGDLKPVTAYRDPEKPLAGLQGIEELVRAGKLRTATRRDYEEWRTAAGGRDAGRSVTTLGQGEVLFRTYVVLKPIVIPADLYGANAVTFIVPRGVVRPQGNPGHCQVLDINNGRELQGMGASWRTDG